MDFHFSSRGSVSFIQAVSKYFDNFLIFFFF